MIDRRNFIAGAAMASAVGVAEWLRPRDSLLLMPQGLELKQLVPTSLPGWAPDVAGDIIIPRTEGSLAATLYSDQLARAYRSLPADGPGANDVMLLIAYGKSQSDYLQLHRPEVCYPATGFTIEDRRFVDVVIGDRRLPAVAMTVRAGERVEDLIYWTRLGEELPRTAGEQRRVRLRAAMKGYVGDGALVRASAVRIEGKPQFDLIDRFLSTLVLSLNPQRRRALIG